MGNLSSFGKTIISFVTISASGSLLLATTFEVSTIIFSIVGTELEGADGTFSTFFALFSILISDAGIRFRIT